MLQFEIIKKHTLSSTNDYLKQLLLENELQEGTVVRSIEQTLGRGQGTNTWESETGKNLTFSLLLTPSFIDAGEMFVISKVISLGIVGFLQQYNKNFSIKWPNDIYWNNKKICGILIENQLLGCCLKHSTIGVGLNINQDAFYSDAPNPISLKTIINESSDIDNVLIQVLESIAYWYSVLCNKNLSLINNTYFKNLYRNQGFYKYKTQDEVFKAKIESVDNDGLLNLISEQGELKSFYFKEVEFIL